MAKKQSTAKSANRSDVIRDILKQQPKATAKEIKAALDERGVKASDALINKIKYGRKSASAVGRKVRGRRRGNSAGSKADAIRNMLHELGAHARPRDVIAALASRGVVVSSAQVSTLRKTLSNDRRRPVVGTSHSVSLDHLRAAKHLADRLGGIEVARQALAGLAALMQD